ncbi:hypothetical protein ACVWZ6_008812 [Bradyrhizobium sp. GM6.1]
MSSIDSEVRKNGRMVSPEAVASRPMKAEKIDHRHGVSSKKRKSGEAHSCLAQIGRIVQRCLAFAPWYFGCRMRPSFKELGWPKIDH